MIINVLPHKIPQPVIVKRTDAAAESKYEEHNNPSDNPKQFTGTRTIDSILLHNIIKIESEVAIGIA